MKKEMLSVPQLDKIIQDRQDLIEHNIVKIFLFGSFARGEETIYSDIDIALVFEGSSRVTRGSSYDFKDSVETEIQKFHREIGWFNTNEYNLETSEDIFNTNTRIKEEGILLWTRTAI